MNKFPPKTNISPDGFRYAIHKQPSYRVRNLRDTDGQSVLGELTDGEQHRNSRNFPADDVFVDKADTVFEIPNTFFFRGATFILQSWAESKVDNPNAITLPQRASASLCQSLSKLGITFHTLEDRVHSLSQFPEPVLLAMAANSTDADDLTTLAHMSCTIHCDAQSTPTGLLYQNSPTGIKPSITNHTLFEIVVNNQYLPDSYKEVMVLRPGVQGNSEIVGEWQSEHNHIYEYLRQNSYIPWGHYAANMANDSIRYHAKDLGINDMEGLRHLYYQRTFTRLAEILDIPLPTPRQALSDDALETLRLNLIDALAQRENQALSFTATLWGWNYGFDCSANGYRLHASHQMIHQQFAMLPSNSPMYLAEDQLADEPWQSYTPYSCGDLIADCMTAYQRATSRDFFTDFELSIRNNKRMDGREDLPASLIIYEDPNVLLFVPKAQTSQWELQLLVNSAGNILEADTQTRESINKAMLIAIKTLSALGAEMVSTIEFPKRLQVDSNQRLLYSFLPKLPYSAGAFSEAQLRWICGHYPEDFARACREKRVEK